MNFGSARLYVVCQPKSYRGTDSSVSTLPSGIHSVVAEILAAQVHVRRQRDQQRVLAEDELRFHLVIRPRAAES